MYFTIVQVFIYDMLPCCILWVNQCDCTSPVEECNMDVRDRALMYYRLLELDVNKAKEVVCPPRNAQINVTTSISELEYKV